MAETREFKTESKRLLDLMINSIYTHKEIFIRELVSNASDAIDKYHFTSLTEDIPQESEYEITIEVDKENNTITLKDNGIGMTEEDLVTNLGTIAKSGSKDFVEKLKEAKDNKDIDIIGQFGVGFYSAFMVADKVVVTSKSPFSDKAYTWTSNGEDTYQIEESTKDNHGTEIKLYLRKDNEEADELYSDYLETWKIKSLVKKYSDYVRYPIKMEVTSESPKYDDEGEIIEGEYESVTKIETLNSMIPIWKKSKSEISEEEIEEFYKYQFNDYEKPLKVIHNNVEGNLTYTSMIFIPKNPPYDLHSKNYEKGLQLYSKGVFIMDKCKELVPEWMLFVRGLVDSSDLSLNISREILQQNKQLTSISKNIEKRVKNELQKMLRNDRENYVEFYNHYGVNIKYGVYDSYGAKKDLLKDLLMFKSTETNELTTLKEYVERLKVDQDVIYYATGANKEQIMALPQMDLLKKKGLEVLILTDDIDEFAINILAEYDEKKFKSINQGDLDLATDEEKKEIEEQQEAKKDILSAIKEALGDSVSDVRLSTRLVENPVCLVSSDGMSFEMEKVLSQMPNSNDLMKAERILEINPNHELFTALEKVHNDNNEMITDFASILYNQALLIEGLPIEDPVDFTNKMVQLMIKVS